MKNQYFGDINDYRKYGLLRAIIRASALRVLVAWMLTPDDGSSDGKFTAYLAEPGRWAEYDRLLYQQLNKLMSGPIERSVSLIEAADLLDQASYYAELTPDSAMAREQWFNALLRRAEFSELVFLDPDNGIEVKSKLYGRRKSSKFLYWREIDVLWSAGKSLLIYQHFPREKRSKFIERMLATLQIHTPASVVVAFSTSNVVFLMALQPEHHDHHAHIVQEVGMSWSGQITHWEPVSPDEI